MPYTVHILAGKKQSIHAIHGRPAKVPAKGAARTLLIMMHDFPGKKTDNNDMYGDLEATLNEKGYHTLRFDFRGCGESDGKPEDFCLTGAYDDLHNAMLWGREKGYKRFVLIGEGLGAAIAVSAADRDIRAMVLLWPMLQSTSFRFNTSEFTG